MPNVSVSFIFLDLTASKELGEYCEHDKTQNFIKSKYIQMRLCRACMAVGPIDQSISSWMAGKGTVILKFSVWPKYIRENLRCAEKVLHCFRATDVIGKDKFFLIIFGWYIHIICCYQRSSFFLLPVSRLEVGKRLGRDTVRQLTPREYSLSCNTLLKNKTEREFIKDYYWRRW